MIILLYILCHWILPYSYWEIFEVQIFEDASFEFFMKNFSIMTYSYGQAHVNTLEQCITETSVLCSAVSNTTVYMDTVCGLFYHLLC